MTSLIDCEPVRQRFNFKLAVYVYICHKTMLHKTKAQYLVKVCQLVSGR